MSTRDLIDAIAAGDSVAVQAAFQATISQRIAERLDTMRQDVAQNMFKEAANSNSRAKKQMSEEDIEEELELDEAKVGDNHIHVQQVGNKYKVHAVGKNFADGIKAGEHLSDSELDDFQEMGGKIKHVKGEIK